MPKIESIISWLVDKTYHIENCKSSSIDIGTLTNFIHLEQKNGRPDPLKIQLNYRQRKRRNEKPILGFRINDDEEYTTQFIKRIEYTPFYYCYTTGRNFSLDLIDFYQWDPPMTHYRIFVIQHNEINPVIKIYYSLNGTFKTKQRQIDFSNWNLHVSSDLSWNEDEACFILKQVANNTYQSAVLFALQWDQHNQFDFSPDSVFAQLKVLEAKSRETHIRNFFIINDSLANRDLDDLWMKQKLFTPERKLDDALVQYPGALTWAIQLALSMGWMDILSNILKMLKEENKKETVTPRLIYWEHFLDSFFNPESNHHTTKTIDLTPSHFRRYEGVGDPFDHLIAIQEHALEEGQIVSEEFYIYCAYFSDILSEERILTFLQFWWNVYSQSLFNRKFNDELKQNPEKIFIIYLLALKLNLPWAEYLYNYSRQFYDNEIFQVIAFIMRRLYTRHDAKGLISIFPGPKWDNNIKRMDTAQGNLSLAFTKYGKKKYLTLRHHKQLKFRIDREVRLLYDMISQNITIIPNVAASSINPSATTVIAIEVASHRISLPLLWRQGEVFLAGLRFRWVFKKNRFQFTVIRKNKIDRFLINDQKFVFEDSYKKKFYLYGEKKNSQIRLELLDQYGRSFHQRILSPMRDVLLSGYCLDSYGLFLEHFNYNYAKRNRLGVMDQSGRVLQKIELPPDLLHLTIQIKKYKKQFDLIMLKDNILENILKFSPQEWFTDFIIIIDNALMPKLPEINMFFERYFSFRPHFRIDSDDLAHQSGKIFIHLCGNHSAIKIEADNNLSTYPILEVGIKGDLNRLEDLYSYLIEPFKKMKLESDSA